MLCFLSISAFSYPKIETVKTTERYFYGHIDYRKIDLYLEKVTNSDTEDKTNSIINIFSNIAPIVTNICIHISGISINNISKGIVPTPSCCRVK